MRFPFNLTARTKMTDYIVAIFPDETRAFEGRNALGALHDRGELSLFAAAVLVKKDDGTVSVRGDARPAPLGIGLTALIGGLVGLLAGPAVAAFGAVAGAVSGSFLDLLQLGRRGEFLEEVSGRLAPGKSAVIAEVAEDDPSVLDRRIAELGGVVLREPRPELDDDRIEKEAATQKAVLAQLEAEQARVDEHARAELKDRVAEARNNLSHTCDRTRAMIARLDEETQARLGALQDQAARANAEFKEQIENRISEIRAEHERRAGKLRRALELAQEALRP